MDERLEIIKNYLEENQKISVIQLNLIKDIRTNWITVIDGIDVSEGFTDEEMSALEKIRDYLDHLDKAEVSYKKLQSLSVSDLSTPWGEPNVENIIKTQKILEKEIKILEEYATFINNTDCDSLFYVFIKRKIRSLIKNHYIKNKLL